MLNISQHESYSSLVWKHVALLNGSWCLGERGGGRSLPLTINLHMIGCGEPRGFLEWNCGGVCFRELVRAEYVRSCTDQSLSSTAFAILRKELGLLHVRSYVHLLVCNETVWIVLENPPT